LRPENTLAAFRHALELGVATLELDVRVTADGVPVVHHDPVLSADRCAAPPGRELPRAPIREIFLEELEGIDCGSVSNPRFPRQKPVPGAGIPKLEEVLALADEARYPVRFSVEIKKQGGISHDDAATAVIDLLTDKDLEDRSIIQSYDPGHLVAAARIAPSVDRAILVRWPWAYGRMVEKSEATILSPKAWFLFRPRAVKSFQARGIAVIPWTVNGGKRIRRMLSWGVDGVITDEPDVALGILAARD
jgi:glycerophosphoryl diester phosphodiesterase